MGNPKELKGLGSVLRLPDGDGFSVEELTKEEWERYQHRMLENLERQMEYYYMQHPET